jgi:hypothetical protein
MSPIKKTGRPRATCRAHAIGDQMARVTLPERKHRVQTFFLVTVPFSLTLTV